MSLYKNKNIAIIGLSVEGIDTAAFFSGENAQVTCCDRRSKEELADTFQTLSPLVCGFHLGAEYLSRLEDFDLIVRTPGMSLETPELKKAHDRGAEITSLTKLFFAHCKAPIIGVTGTKGKGTTSTLLYEILRSTGKRVWLGGNVGVPLLSKVRDIDPEDYVVLELSSFQLEDLHVSPHIAVVLKITQEHLANYDPLATNYHVSREAYVEAKRSIVRYQKTEDVVIYNADDPTSTAFGHLSKAKAFAFSRSGKAVDAYVRDNTVYLTWNGLETRVCSGSEIQLLGIYNLENIAAASLVGAVSGVPAAAIQKTVRAFKGLEHRLEWVRNVRDVSYYNDTFSTIPDTTIAAMHSFREPLVLILGGSEKGSDYTELGREIAQANIRSLIIIGEMTEKIRDAVGKAGFTGDIVTGLPAMPDIVKTAAQKAKKGDVVLLSPACASFGMFKNYKERGKQFKYEVGRL